MSEELTLPFAPGSDTSKAAAKRMAAKPGVIRADHRRILNVLLAGPLTDKEIQRILDMPGSTERPRRGELVAMGRVYDTGERRDRSAVWGLVS